MFTTSLSAFVTDTALNFAVRASAFRLASSSGSHSRVPFMETHFLVVLDEPNSNLDAEGEAALTQAILSVRKRGGIAVVVSHRPSAIAGVDTVLIMNQGRAFIWGPKDEVYGNIPQPAVPQTSVQPQAGTTTVAS